MSSAALAVQLGGLGLEILGVLLMADAYLDLVATKRGKLRLLASALVRGLGRGGATAEGARMVREAGFSAEDSLRVLRGLACIAFGFVLQAIGIVLAYLSAR